MAGHVELLLTAGTPEPCDGLCPDCLNPALWKVVFYTITDSGVMPAATWSGCAGCDAPGEIERG